MKMCRGANRCVGAYKECELSGIQTIAQRLRVYKGLSFQVYRLNTILAYIVCARLYTWIRVCAKGVSFQVYKL